MKHRYLKNVATLGLDTDKCVGCTRCVQVCPHGVLEMRASKAVIVDFDSCMECGACVRNCAPAALAVKPGVGCAAAIIHGFLTGSEPNCDCGGSTGCC